MKIVASLFSRARILVARKQVVAPKQEARVVRSAQSDAVAQAYLKFGPRIARSVARASRAKRSPEGPSRWAMA